MLHVPGSSVRGPNLGAFYSRPFFWGGEKVTEAFGDQVGSRLEETSRGCLPP